MAIEVSCRKCGKAYRVREERAGTKIRCKECQTSIAVPEAAFDDQVDNEFGDDWTQEEPRALPGRAQPRAKKVAASAASFTVRKIFGVLALMLAAVMCLGIGFQVLQGNLRPIGGIVVVVAVGGVGMKWLRT